MSNPKDVLFQAPKSPYQFGAIAYIWGKFIPNTENEGYNFVKGILKTVEGLELLASISQRQWDKITKKANFKVEEPYYWRLYYRTTKQGYLTKINLISPLINPTNIINESGETIEENKDIFQIRGRIDRIFSTAFSIRVERNEKPPEGQEDTPHWKPFWITVQGDLPSEALTEQFWEILCNRNGESLHLLKATYIPEENTELTEKEAAPSLELEVKEKEEQPIRSASASSPDDVAKIKGKIPEITIKFSEKPIIPEQGKKVTLEVTGENNVVVKAEINRKTLAKQIQKIDSLESGVASLSGKLSAISTDGTLILEAATVQIFESKKKEEKTELSDDAA